MRKARRIKKRIYLDYAAATPVDPAVQKAMNEVQRKFWANPSSLHGEGQACADIMQKARIEVAKNLNCRASEIYFMAGATEALNIAIQGVCQRFPLTGKPHIITSSIEHSAVLEPIRKLVKEGKIEATFVEPNEKGIVSPEKIEKEIRENTILICLQHANNEIGTLQPISKINKPKNVLLLVDASASFAYEQVTPEKFHADILVLDGSKIYGPKRSAVLFLKTGTEISPIMSGGGQESGLRPGTEDVAAATGLAKAVSLAVAERESESKRLTTLRDYAIGRILNEVQNSSLNGDQENRLPNNINICFASPKQNAEAGFPKVDSEFLVIKLDTLGFAVSAASACTNLSTETSSYVIEALNKPGCAGSSLRITLGKETTKKDLDKFITALKKVIN
jgi:cysteine desulfurase